MKRNPVSKTGARFGNILEAFSKEQLQWIGAVAMAYNEVEGQLHRIAGTVINFPADMYTVTSRINGTDGLVAIIETALIGLSATDDVKAVFSESLKNHGFTHLKPFRDAVIHSVLFDTHTAIAVAPGKRGTRSDVLLSSEALEALYQRLVLLKDEFDELETIIAAVHKLKRLDANDPQREPLEQSIQRATAQCRGHQRLRKTLKPFPEFPEQPQLHELVPQWVVPKS